MQTKSQNKSNNKNKANYNNNKNKNKNSNNTITCNYYKRKGHLEENYYKKNNSTKGVNNSNLNNIDNNSNKEETILSTNKANYYKNNNIDFILDSSATIYTCYIKELFNSNSIKPTSTSIKWGNTNNSIKASFIGDISIYFKSINRLVTIKDVLYILELGVNLLSLSLITNKGFSLSFNKDNYFIYTPNNSLLTKGSYKGVSIFSTYSSKYFKSNNNNNNNTLSIINTIENKDNNSISNIEDSNLDNNSKVINLEEENNNLNKELNSYKELIIFNKKYYRFSI